MKFCLTLAAGLEPEPDCSAFLLLLLTCPAMIVLLVSALTPGLLHPVMRDIIQEHYTKHAGYPQPAVLQSAPSP